MAKTLIPCVRVSPFDIPLDLYQLADDVRSRENKTWKVFLTEGIRLAIAKASEKQNGGIDAV